MEEKKCSKCGEIKLLTEFNKQKLGKNGYRSYCRECQKKSSKIYKTKNKDIIKIKNKIYKAKKKEEGVKIYTPKEYISVDNKKCTICGKIKDINSFGKHRGRKDGHYSQCKDCVKIKNKIYREENKEKISKRKYENKKERLKTDKLFKLKENISCLIRNSFRNSDIKKNNKTNEILGCSAKEFKKHLEKQFKPWMNWENYGKYTGRKNETWQVDHIIPTSSAKTEEELIKLNHYLNLQPLCSYVNQVEKSNN